MVIFIMSSLQNAASVMDETLFLVASIRIPLIIPEADHVFVCFFYAVIDLSDG